MTKDSNISIFGKNLNSIINRIINSNKKEAVLSSAAGSSGALFVSLFSRLSPAPLLVVAESCRAAEDFKKDLEFFSDVSTINFFPDRGTVPYDNQSADREAVGARFQSLRDILDGKSRVTIATPASLMRRIMPPSVFVDQCFELAPSRSYSRVKLPEKLSDMGFRRVETVEEKGEFAVRGDIIDIFPLTESRPARLDFFDDELENLKYFDAETQRSTVPVSSIMIFPALETLCAEESAARALKKLKTLKNNSSPELYHFIEEQIETRLAFPGMENFLPFFYSEVSFLPDYYPRPPTLVFLEKDNIKKRAELFFDEAVSEYKYSMEEGNPAPEPEVLFLAPDSLFKELKKLSAIDIQALDIGSRKGGLNLSAVDNSSLKALAAASGITEKNFSGNILDQLQTWSGKEIGVVIAAGSRSRAGYIQRIMEDRGLSAPIWEEKSGERRSVFLTEESSVPRNSFLISPESLNSGFRWIDDRGRTKFALITGEEIFGVRQKQQRAPKTGFKKLFSSLEDLKIGDYAVHVEYGAGQYRGLKKIKTEIGETDFLVLVYQNDDKVYVPVDKFHLVQKYVGGEAEKVKINKLGGKAWAKTKSKVKAEIDDIAEEIIAVNAERKAKKGVAFSPDGSLMNEFVLSFPYQETEDQEKAIEEVMKDMESESPMERLVCGDVGFGKTEVAMRAAYKAVIDGYQAGILTPTTILAQQHYESFLKRFENAPVKIGLLSRFQPPRQIKETLKGLKEGSVDIAIGTHRMLSKDVEFKKPGLLVIDEEQRFGVRHKEKIRQYRGAVDILTLSATPIPRTLHMSLVGIRDISVINTPPVDRRAVRVRLVKFNDYIIQESISREIQRRGQVYFIHNRVETIYHIGEYLNKIMPKVKVAIAHGQMEEKKLERVMFDFINKKYDLLLATAIVESGLDITNVNTIIINNAHQFGLSQLYQLRGRVGRGRDQAYAYLMIPNNKILSETAGKRLSVLREFSHLGSGFKIAGYDLQLRGAGNLLGARQSGHIAAVGFEMYRSMVEEAVAKISNGEEKSLEQETSVSLPFEANLPDSYISSMNHRLEAYKNISSRKTEEELWDVLDSLEDRFGKPPQAARNLFHKARIKLLAAEIGIIELNQREDRLEAVFSDKFQPDTDRLFAFLASSNYKLKPLPGDKIVSFARFSGPEPILGFLTEFKKEVCGV